MEKAGIAPAFLILRLLDFDGCRGGGRSCNRSG
jgi:hypothetical protein